MLFTHPFSPDCDGVPLRDNHLGVVVSIVSCPGSESTLRLKRDNLMYISRFGYQPPSFFKQVRYSPQTFVFSSTRHIFLYMKCRDVKGCNKLFLIGNMQYQAP